MNASTRGRSVMEWRARILELTSSIAEHGGLENATDEESCVVALALDNPAFLPEGFTWERCLRDLPQEARIAANLVANLMRPEAKG